MSNALFRDPDTFLLFEPPPAAALHRWTAPLRWYFNPQLDGLAHLDANEPRLYVGNHTLGSIDWPLLLSEVYSAKGIYLRSLGDRMHGVVPLWRDQVGRLGIVEGSRANCAALMEAGEHILVYPGGAREVCKRKGENYTLTWKKRTGFVHMAIKYGYPIQPVASVGADNAYGLLLDAEDVRRSPLGRLLARTGVADQWLRGGDIIPPVPIGLGPTLLPRPERFYFGFPPPIAVDTYRGKQNDGRVLRAVRNRVAKAIEGEISRLLLQRERDRERSWMRRWLTRG